MAEERRRIMIENAHIFRRNFTGREGMYNQAGQRNFLVSLDEKTAKEMAKDGWNVKFPEARDEEEDARDPYIQVNVGYKIRPPRIIMITSTGRVIMTEENVEALDWVDIAMADLIFTASEWSVNGKSGIKAWLKSLFITIEEDELERKYQINDNIENARGEPF
jgi:hypothetical protein